MENLEQNKEIVKRFNKEVIEQCNLDSFVQLMDENFVNQSDVQKSTLTLRLLHIGRAI